MLSISCASNRWTRIRDTGARPITGRRDRRSNGRIRCSSGTKTAIVIGGGWAGFSSAHQLAKAGFAVTVLDASPNPGGLSSGFRTTNGKAVEAGIKGFWWQYCNIYALLDELKLDPSLLFTEWTQSCFYSPQGIEVEAPIFHSLPRLPTPLGSFLYTAPFFRNLPLADRLSAWPLIAALLEFDMDEETYSRYDKMSARELFRSAGVTSRLYRDFLEPILLVTLFAPGEQLSAAAALGALYYYVLAHQSDFDVRWCRGSVVETIFQPWLNALEDLGVSIRGGRKVDSVVVNEEDNTISAVSAVTGDGSHELYEASVVVFAVGIQAMKGIVSSSPSLASRRDFNSVMNLGGIDVLAARLWLDKLVPLRHASNVLAGFDPGSGATVFDLNSLQDEYRSYGSSVIEVDVYHANSLLPLTNRAIVDKLMGKYLPICSRDFAFASVVDDSVLRFRGAVTHFSPGSHQHMPSTRSSLRNGYMAGDWLRQGPGSHGARGLSQEKAYVTGLMAANAAIEDVLGVAGRGIGTEILQVEEDEPHIKLAKESIRNGKTLLNGAGLRWPFL